MLIKKAESKIEIKEVEKLFREYESFLNVDLCFQDFENELANLPGKYSPPDGELLIGFNEEKITGCVAVRKFDEGICEMKRLFVKPESRGTGLGRQLAKEIITIAQKLGYSVMLLDTLDRLTQAMHLYKTLGFKIMKPYYKNPLPGVVYWKLKFK